ncbi:MAG: SIR2 family NAD-dependent protein deacylase [Candidatus Hodarchaeales archaeon]
MNLYQQAAELIENKSKIVAFTGAGISVESGIPDFRSSGGLWEKYNPYEYAEYSAFLKWPEKFWTMHSELAELVSSAEPNPAHIALVTLENLGKLKTVITQNIDFLHQRAGSSRVLELHGTGETASCLSCQKQFERAMVEKILEKVLIPRCPDCGGLIKPNVVLFSEPLPANVFEEAKRELMETDLLIVVGTSISVYPAAALPSLVSIKKTPVIIINDEPTSLDTSASVVIHGKAGEIFPQIINALREVSSSK